MANKPKYPSRYQRVRLAQLMEGRIDCEVSGRWLQFPPSAHQVAMGADTYDMMTIKVMSTNHDGKDRKLCELMLAREELLQILNRMPVKPSRPAED
jgi:hypothetical protein